MLAHLAGLVALQSTPPVAKAAGLEEAFSDLS